MSSYLRIVATSPLTVNGLKSQCDLAPGQIPAMENLLNWLGGAMGGNQSASLAVKSGAIFASGTITFAATGPTNGQTCTICGLTFTAVTSATNPREFTRSNTPSVDATNLAAAINLAGNGLNGIVSASASLGVVTVTAAIPGLIGNGLVMANVDLSNSTFVTLASGTDGTAYTLDFS